MRKILLFSTLFWAFWLVGCASKGDFKSSQAVFVVLKAPQLALNEAGFLYKNKDSTRLEVYKVGQPLVTLEVGQKVICLNSKCALKGTFNKKFFKNEHYGDFLSDILNARPIYKGANLQKTRCGFKQTIKKPSFDIAYSVCNEAVNFKEKKGKINFALRRLDDE